MPPYALRIEGGEELSSFIRLLRSNPDLAWIIMDSDQLTVSFARHLSREKPIHRTMMAAQSLNRYLPGEYIVEPRITLPTLLGLLPDLLTDDLMMFLITLLNENCSLASLISKAGEI